MRLGRLASVPGKITTAEARHSDEPPERIGLEQQLAKEKEEVLRLRDLLIARDAELGTALGRLAELEQSSLHSVVPNLRARAPRLFSLASAVLRRLLK